MPVAEVSGAKIIVRMTDTDRLGSEAKRFMNSRIHPHLNDGAIWVIPFFDHERWQTETKTLLQFGFDFFEAIDQPYEHRSWAKRVCVKYLGMDTPDAQILWINPNDPVGVFQGKSFEVCSYKEFHYTIAMRRRQEVT
jgi:hypothetical protein